MLAEQIGDAVTRGGGLDAGLELPAQLVPDGAGQHAADQNDHAARGMIEQVRRRVGAAGAVIEHRHAEQLARCHEAGESR